MILGLLAFALVVAIGARWFQLAFSVELPNNRGLYLLGMLTGLVLGIASLMQSPGLIGGTLATLAIIFAVFFVFTWAISAQKGGSGTLTPGSQLTPFTALDHQGKTFDSQTLAGKPILLKFFRGHW